jgi:Tfp pilus assembly protein PilZ
MRPKQFFLGGEVLSVLDVCDCEKRGYVPGTVG